MSDTRLDIARDLRAIVELCGDLDKEALFHADDREAPGGDAVVMVAPVANLEAWQNRYETAEAAADPKTWHARPGGRDYAADQEAELHPLLVLATWEDAIRDERDQPTELRATIDRAADYIRGSLDWAFASDIYGDANFLGVDQLAIDLRKCRAMLENLLHDGNRSDVSRVTCINDECESKPRLIKVFADEAARDHHRCPSCRETYDYDEFVRAAKVHAASEIADDSWLTVAIAAHSIGRPARTIRTWINDWKVSTQVVGSRPTTIYVLWGDIREAHRDAEVREFRRKARRIA